MRGTAAISALMYLLFSVIRVIQLDGVEDCFTFTLLGLNGPIVTCWVNRLMELAIYLPISAIAGALLGALAYGVACLDYRS